MKVEVRNGNVEKALRLLKRKVQKEGIVKVLKQKEFFEKPSAKRVRKKKQGIKNLRKAHAKNNLSMSNYRFKGRRMKLH